MNNKIKKYQLYGLYCPISNNLMYVGITTNGLNRRLNGHLKSPTNHLMENWILGLKLMSLKPEIKIIKECINYDDLLKSEIEEIKKCRDEKIEILNIADGGDINPMLGKTHSDEARKKISKIHKGRKLTQKQLEERKILLKELWSNEEWSNKVREKMKQRVGEKNSNWRGGLPLCECGNIKKKKSKTCFKCRDLNGEKNPFFGKKHTDEVMKKWSDNVKLKGVFKGKNNPNYKYDIDINILRDLFINQNKTVDEIKLIFGCCRNTINNLLRQNNIYKPKSNKYNLNIIQINEYLSRGLNYAEIGRIYGCSNKIIFAFVKRKKDESTK
jgi:group I intron endonuclease